MAVSMDHMYDFPVSSFSGISEIQYYCKYEKPTQDTILYKPVFHQYLCRASTFKVDLSKAYPMVSFGYVIAVLLGYFMLGEELNAMKIAYLPVLYLCLQQKRNYELSHHFKQ